jgi:DNA-binding winged helix-turn-helix (wHTH) protein/tetratricopeptide (TPR) repeat protein
MSLAASEKEICFGPYELDLANARLLREGTPVSLAPKALDVLHYLASRPDRLVTKNELLSNVWPDVVVSDASIKVCVREIRKALDDLARTPTYIETVHRKGYRFIAPVDEHATFAKPIAQTETSESARAPVTLVGRAGQLAKLREIFETGASGRRQCVFIAGQTGSGKTALVEALTEFRFKANTDGGAAAQVLYGHCFQQFGSAEPYMPVWEALGRVLGGDGSGRALALLARHAAAAYAAAARSTSPPTTPSAASDRLLRQLVEAIELLSAQTPLILVLEDVHWADYSTIDLISALARRDTPAKLLLIATYRPAEVTAAAEHPLAEVVHGLATADRCSQMPLDYLDEPTVQQFLAARFPGAQFPAALARRLYQRTDGCPLFLVHLLDDLIDQGVLSQHRGVWALAGADDKHAASQSSETPAWLAVLDTQIPQTVRAMIESQIERLPNAARAALEAAAVVGIEFSAAAVAAAAGVDVIDAERACDQLARRHRFLEQRGIDEWPDGTVATHYRFVHELYHAVVNEQVPIARRVLLHREVGLRLESAWGDRTAEEAANLAIHFETARDWPRAVKYFGQAAQTAGRHHAHREAVHYLRRALAAVERLSEPERDQCELDVLNALGVNLQVTRGFASPEVEAIHARAHALCMTRGSASADLAKTFPALWGIWLFHKVRSDLHKASEMCDELLKMAEGNSSLMLQAHQAVCVTNLCLGKPQITCEHMERAWAIYDPKLHAPNAQVFGQDPGVATQAFGAVALWQMGRTPEAIEASDRALSLAEQLRQPSSRALAMHFAAMLHQCRGDADQAAKWSAASMELAEDEGFSFWRAGGLVLNGWSRAALAGDAASMADAESAIDDIRRGLQAWVATGSRTYHTYYLGLLADALQRVGRARESRHPLEEALAETQTLSEGLYEAELHRLVGSEILLTSHEPSPPEAQLALRKAVSVARAQGARALADRAANDLATISPTRPVAWSRSAIRTSSAILRDPPR